MCVAMRVARGMLSGQQGLLSCEGCLHGSAEDGKPRSVRHNVFRARCKASQEFSAGSARFLPDVKGERVERGLARRATQFCRGHGE